jgi:hypothetical protein
MEFNFKTTYCRMMKVKNIKLKKNPIKDSSQLRLTR